MWPIPVVVVYGRRHYAGISNVHSFPRAAIMCFGNSLPPHVTSPHCFPGNDSKLSLFPFVSFPTRAGKTWIFYKKFVGFQVFRFLVLWALMYDDRSQNYDYPEIHEEYIIHDTPFLLTHHL